MAAKPSIKTIWIQILRGFLAKNESMSMDLKNAENRIKKYLKLAKLERNHLNAKIDFFFGAQFALQWRSLLHLLKSSDLCHIWI